MTKINFQTAREIHEVSKWTPFSFLSYSGDRWTIFGALGNIAIADKVEVLYDEILKVEIYQFVGGLVHA